jgi:hypothetical protein
MSLPSTRSLSTTASTYQNLVKLVGKVTLEDVYTLNGEDGAKWVYAIQIIRDNVAAQLSSKARLHGIAR